MAVFTPTQSYAAVNIFGVSNVAELERSGNKVWWKSRFVQVVAVGVLATAALFFSNCYLAAAIIGAVTAVTAIGFTVKYFHGLQPVCSAIPASNGSVPVNTPVRTSSHKSVDPFRLQRFVDAQNHGYMGAATHQTALKEMQNGKKVTHWSWYELPIVEGFGQSDVAQYFALKSLEEIRAYYAHGTLKANLISIFQSINCHGDKSIKEIMGGDIDAAKLKSCATIFFLVTRDPTFLTTLTLFFAGSSCQTARLRFSQWQQAM